MIKPEHSTEPKKEPGLLDSVGSFPLWMLKIIVFITPACLKKAPLEQEPPKK